MGKRNTPEKIYNPKGYINEKSLRSLCATWHEAGRAKFESLFKNLRYDTYQLHSVVHGEPWCYFLEGLGEDPPVHCFAVELSTGLIYRTNRKGKLQMDKCIGPVGLVTGKDLDRLRFF